MKDLSDEKFNRLLVIEFERKDKFYNSYWKCRWVDDVTQANNRKDRKK